jgi:hypothetical protein
MRNLLIGLVVGAAMMAAIAPAQAIIDGQPASVSGTPVRISSDDRPEGGVVAVADVRKGH